MRDESVGVECAFRLQRLRAHGFGGNGRTLRRLPVPRAPLCAPAVRLHETPAADDGRGERHTKRRLVFSRVAEMSSMYVTTLLNITQF